MRKKSLGLALTLALTAFSSPSWGQQQGGSAPALLNVKEIILQFTRIGDPAAASTCGLAREALSKSITKILIDEGLPVTPVSDIKPPTIGLARIDLIPEIASVTTPTGDCTSWVAMTAQSQNNVRVPPIEIPRSVIVTYWRSGLLINSNRTIHPRVLEETMQKLAKNFAKQYRLDQPPSLPNLDEPSDSSKPAR